MTDAHVDRFPSHAHQQIKIESENRMLKAELAELRKRAGHVQRIKDAWESRGFFCTCSNNIIACDVCQFEAVLNSE